MYYLQTISPRETSDEALKYEATLRNANNKFVNRKTPSGSYKRHHDDLPIVHLQESNWAKNCTLSSKDLIWGSCSPREEEFMSIADAVSRLPLCMTLNQHNLTETAAAFFSLMDNPPTIAIPTEVFEQGYPRFRQDLIMDREDVNQKLLEFQTVMLRKSNSSESQSTTISPETKKSASETCVDLKNGIVPQKMCYLTTMPSSDKQETTPLLDDTTTAHTSNDFHLATFSTPPMPAETQDFSSKQPQDENTVNLNGARLRLHDEQRIYAAMDDDGNVGVVQCIGCSRYLLATSDIKLVYCPGCGTITPLEIGSHSLPHTPSCDSVARMPSPR